MLFPIEYASIITIIAISLVIYLIITGFRDGFVLKGIELLSTVICAIVAWIVSTRISSTIPFFPEYSMFQNELLNHSLTLFVNRILLFIILFMILRILIIFVRPLFKSINWIPFVGLLNKMLGGVLGYLQAYIILVIVSFIFTTPLFINGHEVLKESKLVYVKDIFQTTSVFFDREFEMVDSLQKMFVSSPIDESDFENISTWLGEQGFNANEINEVIILLRQRSESYERKI